MMWEWGGWGWGGESFNVSASNSLKCRYLESLINESLNAEIRSLLQAAH